MHAGAAPAAVLLFVAAAAIGCSDDDAHTDAEAWHVRSTGRQWRYIVLHHSATEAGNAETFGRFHRRRGWDGLGYHFVIDNGRGGPDGQVEVGPRWTTQKQGAHCGHTPGDEYNRHGIGICLVGDFTRSDPSPAQQAALNKLLRHLMKTFGIAASNVIGHCQAPNQNTACPGRTFLRYVQTTLRGAL